MIQDTYLLDTCVLSRLFDNRPEAEQDEKTRKFRARLKTVEQSRLLICAVVAGEVEYGLRAALLPDLEQQTKVRRMIKSFPVTLHISPETAVPHYAQARANIFLKFAPQTRRRRRGISSYVEELMDPTAAKALGIQENDLWIAAVALQYNLVLVTDDRLRRICEAVPDLRVENWLE